MFLQIPNTRSTINLFNRRGSSAAYTNLAEMQYARAQRQSNISLPRLKNVDVIQDLYKTSFETRMLTSEVGRHAFGDVFVTDRRLGPLSDLCVAVLAKHFLPDQLPYFVTDNFEHNLIYYDNLSTNLPLESCYKITSDRYWKRVVLTKTNNVTMVYQGVNWKNEAISLLVAERMESYSAEYCPEKEVKELADKVSMFVISLKIKRLKSLPLQTLIRNIRSDELSSSDNSSLTSVESIEDVDDEKKKFKRALLQAKRRRHELRLSERVRSGTSLVKMRKSSKLYADDEPEPEQKPKPKPKKNKNKNKRKSKEEEDIGVFDIVVTPPEYDEDWDILDRRNIKKYLALKARMNFPEDDCHHIDLRCLRFFSHLVSFSLQFLSSETGVNFHPQQLKISERDMIYLGTGLTHLKCLKTFRLTDSRMNASKLGHITRALKKLPLIETVDFTSDCLEDDCGEALYDLFTLTDSIKSLELRGNCLGEETLGRLGDALKDYAGVLEYLGLSHNRLGTDGLHNLYAGVERTKQISKLDLCAVSISNVAIACCIAHEFIGSHRPLRSLNISAISMPPLIVEQVVCALQRNYRLVNFDMRGCDLDPESEVDVHVLVRRNQYINEMPFVGHLNVPDEIVQRYLNRVKNPILLRAIKTIEEGMQCESNPDQLEAHETVLDILLGPHRSTRMRPTFGLRKKHKQEEEEQQQEGEEQVGEEQQEQEQEEKEEQQPPSEHIAFENTLQEAESFGIPIPLQENTILEHIHLPGPNDRFHYFRNRIRHKHKHVVIL